MTRQKLVANLIYLILTYVQGGLWLPLAMAAPNTQPVPNKTDSVESQEVNADQSRLESLSISETSSEPASDLAPNRRFSFFSGSTSWLPMSFSGGVHAGAYQQEKTMTLYTFGLDLQYALDPSEKIHGGLLIANKENPFIYLSRESYLRNYWKYLKSWSYLLELEVDSSQGLGAFVSFNYFSAGAGVSFTLAPKWDLVINLLALSSRAPSASLQLSYLAF